MDDSNATPRDSGGETEMAGAAREAEFRARLKYNTNIPSMPAAAVRAIEIGNDPESGIADVVAVIQSDVALTAKILMAANSPVYGMRRKVSNLNQAASMLGLDACMVLILGFSLNGATRQKGVGSIDLKPFWLRSLAAAVAGKQLAVQTDRTNPEQVFLASLLQDIGIIAFDRLEHERYAPLFYEAESHAMLMRLESVAFGLDHARMGKCLLAEWHFPEWMIDAVAASHGKGENPLQAHVCTASLFAEIFTAVDRDVAIQTACDAAQSVLGMSEEQAIEAIGAIQQSMPEYAALFDVEYPCSDDDLVEQARQTMMLRSMRLCTDIVQSRNRAAEYEMQVKELEHKASRDVLTGTYNRAHLDNHLAEQFERASQQQWPLGIAFIDLDHFKKINDTYGHQFGDTVLKGTARCLLANIRQEDLLARYGGEEFVLVMPGIDDRTAFGAVDRLLEAFREYPFATDDGKQVSITFSAGVATHLGERRFDSVRDLVRAADESLYAAKTGGRNQVVLHQDD